MDCLGDSNIWLRSSEPAHPMYPLATRSVATLPGQQNEIYLVPQVVTEYWRVVTGASSARGGLGWAPEKAHQEVQRLELDFPLLPDTPAVYQHWRQIVHSVGVSGAQVYDARLVAAMLAHGLTHILTFNTDDFRRYEHLGITLLHPQDV